MPTDAPSNTPALTLLSEEETMFRDAVAAFAEEEVRPRVMEMEKAGKIDPALLPKYFELGLMGIEVPEQYGGAGGSLFMVTLAVEEISKVDAAAAIVCDVQNTLVNYPINRYGTDAQKSKYLPMLASEVVGAYALSESGSGSDAFGLATRAEKRGDRWILNGQKLWITNGAEAGIFVVFANADPSAGYQGITAFISRARLQGLQGRQEGRQARHPRVEHGGAAARQLRGPRGERPRPGRSGLQDRDQHAERRAHRNRRSDDRRRAGRASTPRSSTSTSASSSASHFPSFRGSSSRSRRRRPRSKPRA